MRERRNDGGSLVPGPRPGGQGGPSQPVQPPWGRAAGGEGWSQALHAELSAPPHLWNGKSAWERAADSASDNLSAFRA